MEIVKDAYLLTIKPILYIANINENQILSADTDPKVKEVREYAKTENAKVIPLCVKIEEELSTLEGEDKKEMLEALGLEESGLDKVIKASYDLLRTNVISNSWKTRSKSMDNKKRYKSTRSGRENSLRHTKRFYKSRNSIIR